MLRDQLRLIELFLNQGAGDLRLSLAHCIRARVDARAQSPLTAVATEEILYQGAGDLRLSLAHCIHAASTEEEESGRL